MVLEPAHIEALKKAGVKSVVVARLEADDEHEDAAAATVARALVAGAGPALRLTAPFTGRVNVIADAPGVVLIDEEKLRQVNRVNPMITVATVPPYQQMESGGMVATVKIISYGVPGADVGKAVGRVRGGLRLKLPEIATASLIVTEIPGGPGKKGRAAIETRLDHLGVELSEVIGVPHETEAAGAGGGRGAGRADPDPDWIGHLGPV